MTRPMTWGYCVLTALAMIAPAPAAEIPVGSDETLPLVRTATELRQRLQRPITVEGFEANTPMRDALGFMSERFGVTLLVDTQAFKDDLKVDEIETTPVKLPKLVQVPMRLILDMVVEQQHGAIIQEGALLWMVPLKRAQARLMSQRVALNLKQESLRNALDEVVAQTGFSIVLDEKRSGEAIGNRITAGFHGVRMDDTVRTLADMAGLKAVAFAGMYYVTTPERADEIAAEEKQRQREQRELEAEKEKKEQEEAKKKSK